LLSVRLETLYDNFACSCSFTRLYSPSEGISGLAALPPSPGSPSDIALMAKLPPRLPPRPPNRDPQQSKKEKKPPRRPTLAKAARPTNAPTEPALAKLLNPAIYRGEVRPGLADRAQPPPTTLLPAGGFFPPPPRAPSRRRRLLARRAPGEL